jgi:hypothetical protein
VRSPGLDHSRRARAADVADVQPEFRRIAAEPAQDDQAADVHCPYRGADDPLHHCNQPDATDTYDISTHITDTDHRQPDLTDTYDLGTHITGTDLTDTDIDVVGANAGSAR